MRTDNAIAERVQRFNAALNSEGFSFAEDNLGAYLLNEDGDRCCRLSGLFVESVNAVPPEHLAEILKAVYLARVNSNEDSFKAGKRAGRREIVSTVHELLGIDTLQESLATIETAMRETGGR